MAFIGNQPVSVAFITDQFSGTGSTTVYTMTVAPANTASALVAVSGVLQDPTTYAVNGTTLTFSVAPPSGTSNISVRYLGIPANSVATNAYRQINTFTATAGQTVFTTSSYTVGYVDVYRNGVLLAAADYTATNGTQIVLATGANVGDLVTTVSFLITSVINALPTSGGVLTGMLTAPAIYNTSPFYYNGRTVTATTTIASSENVFSCGPITINDGVIVTIANGGEWTIV